MWIGGRTVGVWLGLRYLRAWPIRYFYSSQIQTNLAVLLAHSTYLLGRLWGRTLGSQP